MVSFFSLFFEKKKVYGLHAVNSSFFANLWKTFHFWTFLKCPKTRYRRRTLKNPWNGPPAGRRPFCTLYFVTIYGKAFSQAFVQFVSIIVSPPRHERNGWTGRTVAWPPGRLSSLQNLFELVNVNIGKYHMWLPKILAIGPNKLWFLGIPFRFFLKQMVM